MVSKCICSAAIDAIAFHSIEFFVVDKTKWSICFGCVLWEFNVKYEINEQRFISKFEFHQLNMSANEDSLRDNGLIDCFSCEFDICYLAKHGICSNAFAVSRLSIDLISVIN